MNNRQINKLFFIAILLSFCTAAWATKGNNEIKVITQNQYLGADLAPLLSASQDQFNDVLVDVLQKVAANRFHDRVQRQASQIVREHPHVVALQEAWRLDCQDLEFPAAGQGCKNPKIAEAFVDFVQETLLALKAKGLRYKVVASVRNLDVSAIKFSGLPAGIPFFIDNSLALLNTIDRDVILVRDDISARPVDFTNICPDRISLNGCNYQRVVKAPIPGGPPDGLAIERGFVAADVKVHDKHYRIVNTHLELREPVPGDPRTRAFQAAQAQELIQTLQDTTPEHESLLVLGDMNSSSVDTEIQGITPPYWQFVDAGYTDAWTLRRHVTPGYTCCQAEDLQNKRSELFERIDYIFSKQEAWGHNISLVGVRQGDKTLPPLARLWPSDHAGLVGELRFWE